jgi:hypothetical protein
LPGLDLAYAISSGTELHRDGWIDLKNKRYADDASDHRDVADEIEAKFLVDCAVHCIAGGNRTQRITVWGRTNDASVAMLVAAPDRFSTKNGWPRRSESH